MGWDHVPDREEKPESTWCTIKSGRHDAPLTKGSGRCTLYGRGGSSSSSSKWYGKREMKVNKVNQHIARYLSSSCMGLFLYALAAS